ncbi:unnamed protein product, partial [Rotaria sordida]
MIATPVQSPVVLQRQKPGKARHEVTLSTATTNSSATTCSTAISILTTSSSMTKWKNDFVAELLKLKNKSLNNPFFSPERYNQTIELINNAKLKSNAQRSDQEVSLLKTYDVINVGTQQKLVKNINSSEGTWIRENNCTNWAQGLRFVQFQKNSCHHRVLGNSPYSVLFGNQPKIGLASTSLPPLIFNNLSTEEELQKELGLPTCDTNDSDQCESDLESDEDGLDVGGSNVNVISYENTDMKLDQTLKPLNDRIRKTGEIRQVAKEGKKRQADQFLQSTAKKQKLAHINIGDNVLVSVPEIDRGPTDARNVLAVVMDIKHDKYKLGTEQGVLHGYYSFHQLSKAPGTSTLLIENVTEGGTKSLREI